MTIETNIETLDKLLAPRPKIVFAESDMAAAKDLLNGHSAGEAAPDYFIFRPASSASSAALKEMAESNGDGKAVAVSAPPTGVCVLAALTDGGHEQLGELAAWWSEQDSQSPPRMLDLRNGDPGQSSEANGGQSALYQRLFEMTQAELRRADERVAQLHGQLYELRSEYEQARGVMRRIQEFWPKLAPFRLIETFGPSAKSYPEGQTAPSVLRQPLPTSAAGLAAIDLYSLPPASGAVGSGRLFVVLQCLESAAPIAAWRIPYHRLGQGWLRCAFPVALIARARHVELVVTWETDSGDPPRLGLSPVGVYPELRCRTHDARLDDSLAMSLWGTVPGTNLGTSMPWWCSTAGSAPGFMTMEYALEPGDIAGIKSTVNTHVPFVHPLDDVPGFRLHPLEGPASAMLVNTCMANTDRVMCTAQIRNPQALSAVEYAICLTYAKYNCRFFPTAPENDPCVMGYSGWQVVAADRQPHAVSLVLDKPLTEAADLHFATRMKDGASIAYEWADWIEVRIRVRHPVSGGRHLPEENSDAEDGGDRCRP